MGLNESYVVMSIVKVSILSFKKNGNAPFDLVPLLFESLAFSATSSSLSVTTFSYQDKPNHDHPNCSHCGLMGHIVDHCYKLHGCPTGYKPKPKAQLSSLQPTNNPLSFPEPSKDTHFSPSATTVIPPSPLSGSFSIDQVQ